MMHLGPDRACGSEPGPEAWRLEDRWNVSRRQATIAGVCADFDLYRLDDAAAVIYEFVWDELCDWYLELAKPRLHAGGADAAHVRGIPADSPDTSLLLLHPFMPFIT